jgi:FkbM family methyltransferase
MATPELERENILQLIKDTGLREGDLFIDIGSNKGQEIEVLAPMGVEVYSYEPHPSHFKSLEEKYGHMENVHLHNVAVSDYDGEAILYCKESPEALNGGASLCYGKTKNVGGGYLVTKVISANNMFRSINLNPNILVLKIDAEGGEWDILENLITTKWIRVPDYIYMEDHIGIITQAGWIDKRNSVILSIRKENVELLPW